MAYSFTLYFNDAGIATTTSYYSVANETYSGSYGDSYINRSGFDDSLVFTATPADGYAFLRWVYREESTSGTVQYSTDNPFTYSGGKDIFIRAESQEKQTYTITVTYNANGGSGAPPAEEYSSDSATVTVKLQSVQPTRTGYTFLGWATSSTATTAEYAAGETCWWQSSKSLHAVWARNIKTGVMNFDNKVYKPYIYLNGWQPLSAHVYDNGWKITREKKE